MIRISFKWTGIKTNEAQMRLIHVLLHHLIHVSLISFPKLNL